MSRPVPPSTRSDRKRRRPSARSILGAASIALAAVAGVLTVTASPAAAAGSVSLSKTSGINPAGETLTVQGSGFDSSGTRGIYLMFCQQAAGRPTGGQCSGAQNWIGSTAMGAPVAWSGNGTFTATIDVVGTWAGVDCTDGTTVCGVVTRNDHLDGHLFDQDTFTPVSFAVDEPPTTTEAETTTTQPGATTTTKPTTTTVPSGNRPAVSLSASTDLADREVITVSGTGFAPNQGLYVQTCAAPEGESGTAAGRADNCYPEQDGTHTVWINPVGSDGTWSTDLTVAALFGDVDCRVDACGVSVRRDHSGGATDFSQDVFVPITFGSGTVAPPTGSARLSITPSSNLVSGQKVTVDGEGFKPGRSVFVGVCDDTVANFAACDFTNVVEATASAGTARLGGPGSFSISLVVRSTFGSTNCQATTARCVIATWAVSGDDTAVQVMSPISFRTAGGSASGPGGSTTPLPRTGTDATTPVAVALLALTAGFGLLAADRRRRMA
ncbi:MAG: LPXTG cell wall anchor domain-containing protein [Microthrixaceae bacterium]|jgi:LPXTG-motif cell wall-anchored protein|nr:LPXTG cell wall anchor domain-containing protein [Microthrixaceae bacterium]